MSRSPRTNREKIRALWEEGLNDLETAKRLGMPLLRVAAMRRDLGLRAINGNRKRESKVDKQKVLEPWEKGLNDVRIAKLLGASGSTIGQVRKKLGLAPHGRGDKKCVDRNEVNKLWDQGLNDVKIAKLLHASNVIIGHVRRNLGLTPHGRGERKQADEDAVQELWDQDLNDLQIAKRLNVPAASVREARARIGLVSNYLKHVKPIPKLDPLPNSMKGVSFPRSSQMRHAYITLDNRMTRHEMEIESELEAHRRPIPGLEIEWG